jgi:hypothetical protein
LKALMQFSFTVLRLISGLWAALFACALLMAALPLSAQAGSGSSAHSDDEAPEVDDDHRDDDEDRDGDRDDDRSDDRDDEDDRGDNEAGETSDRDEGEDRDDDERSSSSDDHTDDGKDADDSDSDSESESNAGDDDKSGDDDSERNDDSSRSDSKDRDTAARSSSPSGSGRKDDDKSGAKPEPVSTLAAPTGKAQLPPDMAVSATGESVAATPAPLPASESRADRAERMLEIAENKRGERVREGELLLMSASRHTPARLARNGYRVIEAFRLQGLGLRGYRIAVPAEQDADAALAGLRRIDPKGIASFNHIYVPARGGATIAEPAPPGRKASRARRTSAMIGLVDAPVNEGHPMLGSVQVESRTFGLASPTADSHGTAVASRIAEAAPGARIFVASVFSELRDGEEVASVDAITRALNWLALNRIPVINMSLAGPPNPALEAVTGKLVNRGYKLVAAVGNEGPNAEAQYPAAYDGVVGVTAVDRRNEVYIYANQGDYVDFAAPGVDATVAGPDGHTETVSGTSYAAPVIAAELARRLQRPDRALAIRAENELAKSAKDLGEPGRDPVFGFGVIAPTNE